MLIDLLFFWVQVGDLWHFKFYTQAVVQEESKSITDLKATTHEGTERIEAAVRHEAKEIKDQLGEMNQSMDTLASSSAATNLLEAAVHHEAKEIKDQLWEMNHSIDTLASSSAANQSSSG